MNDHNVEIVIWEHYEYRDGWTNNQAEATGLLRGCEYLVRQGITTASFYGDSEIILFGIFGGQDILEPELVPIAQQVIGQLQFITTRDWAQIGRESNGYCDLRADWALDTKSARSTAHIPEEGASALEAAARAILADIMAARAH